MYQKIQSADARRNAEGSSGESGGRGRCDPRQARAARACSIASITIGVRATRSLDHGRRVPVRLQGRKPNDISRLDRSHVRLLVHIDDDAALALVAFDHLNCLQPHRPVGRAVLAWIVADLDQT